MQDRTIERVGVVGLGKMGLPIARHLLRGGFQVTGFDVRPQAMAGLAELGGKPAGSCAEVAASSDLVILIVGFESQVDAALNGPHGLLHGAPGGLVIAVASTVAPSYMRDLAASAGTSGVAFLDIPLTRAERAAEEGTLLLLGGGDSDAFERCRAAFATFASDIAYLGGPGAGQVGKMINNLVLWTCTSVNYEGLKLARTLGVDPEALRKALGMSTAQNWAMDSRSDDRAAPWAEKDMTIVLGEADIARVSIPIAGVVKETIKAYKIERGHPMPKEE